MPPATAGLTTQIFSGDPTRPNAGYVLYNGSALRVMGLTSAGSDAYGQPKPLAGSKYLLQGADGMEFVGPDVIIQDYLDFVNTFHGVDTASGPSGSVEAFSTPTAEHVTGNDTSLVSIPRLFAVASGSSASSGSGSSGSSSGPRSAPATPHGISFTTPQAQPTVTAALPSESGSGESGSGGSGSGGSGSGTSGVGTGGETGSSGVDPTIQALLGVIGQQYAGGGGAGGVVALPTPLDSGGSSDSSSSPSYARLFLLVGIIALTVFWYRHHHKKGEAK